MSFISFLKLVEIQTKVASLIPFLLGTFYAIYRFDTFNLKNFIYMFISLLFVDMTTTAINNYQDFRRANKKHGYGYETHNAIVKFNLKESTVVAIIFIILIIAITFGILLFLNTNIIILILGAISFTIGVLYSFGPIPISRTPFGEIFSGLFMGFIITFISIYIHVFDQNLVSIILHTGLLNMQINYLEIIYIFLLSIPCVTGIANIMLANNICDIEDDIANKRYTLPIYIGKKNSLKVYRFLYYIGYVSLTLLVIVRVLPLLALVALLTLFIVKKHINIFCENQSKKDTFILSIKNFVIINVTQVIIIAISVII
ncbi:1,4-dihydroxy-2-naphthoate polyprenyltransferase [Sporosalibacterium faouarense]|uniref:1,4-dihydroxy-2-naphthoate polyprenyltransferase n=1 Tax=Sporosalibacterium faouarense TaxID=516123 RepID=UPI00192C62A5|nr:1,4-dihydroxy-2-naphthoate polyprenyltransferase [Sporosalibacterium faouarense]